MRTCELDFSLEEVLQKFDKTFQKKILHSVELLRKSEKLAEAYDPADHFFLAFSGGKDANGKQLVSDTRIYSCSGNGIVVSVLEFIFHNMFIDIPIKDKTGDNGQLNLF